MKTPLTKQLLAHSKEHYRDYMLVPPEGQAPPAWFVLFLWMELFFHVPVSVWSVGALWRGTWHALLFFLFSSRDPTSHMLEVSAVHGMRIGGV